MTENDETELGSCEGDIQASKLRHEPHHIPCVGTNTTQYDYIWLATLKWIHSTYANIFWGMKRRKSLLYCSYLSTVKRDDGDTWMVCCRILSLTFSGLRRPIIIIIIITLTKKPNTQFRSILSFSRVTVTTPSNTSLLTSYDIQDTVPVFERWFSSDFLVPMSEWYELTFL